MQTYQKKLTQIEQQWKTYSENSTLQKLQRGQDLNNLLEAIQKKIQTTNLYQTTKTKILTDQCNTIQANISKINHSAQQILTKSKQYVNQNRNRTLLNCNILQQDIENDYQVSLQIAKQQVDELRNQRQSKISKQCKQLQQSHRELIELKNHINSSLKQWTAHKHQSLNTLYSHIQNQITQISNEIQINRNNKKFSHTKLMCLSQNMLGQLQGIIEREENLGKLTYDSLLSLIEDFHNYLHVQNRFG